MKKTILKRTKGKLGTANVLIRLALSIIIGFLVAAWLYFRRVFYSDIIHYPMIPGIMFFLTTVIFFSASLFFRKRWTVAVLMLLVILGATKVCNFPKSLEFMLENDIYQAPDTKKELYSGRSVLVVTPHQDDEINQMGGVIEEFIKYGSEVKVLYSTNGDYNDNAAQRFEDALQCLEALGVERNNVIFLGYGDYWQNGHLWDSKEGEIKNSHAGYDRTYAPEGYSIFREGREYTKENFIEDLYDSIMEVRAEIICCVDYDEHDDHRALSFAFETAMKNILKNSDYRPVILKSFAYSLAWSGVRDYDMFENLSSTYNWAGEEYMTENNIYLWKDRLRLPVSAASLARNVENSELYKAMIKHSAAPQIAVLATAIINSDKVFWQRETESLLYDVNIEVSSGSGEKLNDFLLCDSEKVSQSALPTQGTWVPEKSDKTPRIVVSLGQKQDIKRIYLYDNPSIEDNILKVSLKFSDGTELVYGPLLSNGSASEIVVDKKDIDSFEISILEREGEKAGLTEIEAYEKEKTPAFPFIKLTDTEGCFAYDWRVDEEMNRFELYSPAILEPLSDEKFGIEVNGNGCEGWIKDGEILVKCPKGQRCTLRVIHKESGLKDAIRIWHPSTRERKMLDRGQIIYDFLKQNSAQNEIHRNAEAEVFWSSILRLILSKA